MTDPKALFEFLKREGECLHEWRQDIIPFREGTWSTTIYRCERCNAQHSPVVPLPWTPNLTSPNWDTLGWVKDRLIEKKLFVRFCNYCWEKLYGVIPPAVWGGSLPEEYIDPSCFVQMVEEWRLSLHKEERNRRF